MYVGSLNSYGGGQQSLYLINKYTKNVRLQYTSKFALYFGLRMNKVVEFWDVTPCGLVGMYDSSGRKSMTSTSEGKLFKLWNTQMTLS